MKKSIKISISIAVILIAVLIAIIYFSLNRGITKQMAEDIDSKDLILEVCFYDYYNLLIEDLQDYKFIDNLDNEKIGRASCRERVYVLV